MEDRVEPIEGPAPPPESPPEETPQAPRKSPLESADDYSKHEIRSKTEILYILRSMAESGVLITVYFNQGNDFLLTSLLDIAADGSTLVLDVGSNAEMNRRALQSEKLICIGSHRKVKVQFSLNGVDEISFEGRKAFLGNVPDSMARVQRRDFYRLTTPRGNPLLCHIPVQEADGSSTIIDAVVVDISGGGLAVIVPPDDVHFQPDREFPNCSLSLPGVGNIAGTLRVLKIYEETLANGKIHKRSGCQFVKLPVPMMTLIQRYIIKVDSERRARELGLL